MTKRATIIVSILLITASAVIDILIKTSSINPDKYLINFFVGLLFGAGIALLLQLAFGKKKK